MKSFSRVAGAALIAIPMMFAAGSASADGKAAYGAKGCAGCHGPTGMGALGPRLAGQMKPYLVEQFKLIRDGQRTSGKSGMMAPAVKAVTDGDIDAIATYLSGLK